MPDPLYSRPHLPGTDIYLHWTLNTVVCYEILYVDAIRIVDHKLPEALQSFAKPTYLSAWLNIVIAEGPFSFKRSLGT